MQCVPFSLCAPAAEEGSRKKNLEPEPPYEIGRRAKEGRRRQAELGQNEPENLYGICTCA